ncbi:ubiquitin-like protein [Aspergillus piperis CBS 112811]|uniref:Ubiquitin-like modifier HUB1 n=1 Tax=Aspergillus piperis CBS 112811 TaxID=1448313 RepID=A0A8G1VMV9_9EURO|nr:ubiquitin-like protein [Aspergillus piperis CBS 112811]RAH59121.1 ubiquitin-like protein [Aspergillus piperis CBS 112811]
MPDSPPRRRRSRSRSPRRHPPKGPGGFRWKEKRAPPRDDNNPNHETDRPLDRGYRARSPPRRDSYRDNTSDRYGDRDRYRRDYSPDCARDRDRERDRDSIKPKKTDSEKKEKKEKKKKLKPASTEEMILVTVNDRLGSKATVPCLPSDTVGDLKVLVAAQIGRAPREIMLKRQGERPFKDFITLGDYSITNGVQLDLEIGTGD